MLRERVPELWRRPALGGEEDARLELGEVAPGSFADALNALQPDVRVHADRFDDQVLVPFWLTTCLRGWPCCRTCRC